MSVAFEPRRLADGRICCTHDYAMCPACESHHNRLRISPDTQRASDHHLLRTAAPDSYRQALADRAAAAGVKDDRARAMAEWFRVPADIRRAEALDVMSTATRAAAEPSKSDVHLNPPSPYPAPRVRTRSFEYSDVAGRMRPTVIRGDGKKMIVEYAPINGEQRPITIVELDE